MMKFIVLFLLVGGGIYLQWQNFALEKKRLRVEKETAVIAEANEEQRLKSERLKILLDDIRANPDEIFEELAREKLFMIKEGEMYLLPGAEAK